MSPSPQEYVLTTGEVAEQVGASQDSVSRWADLGLLASMRTPGKWRKFRQVDVDAFLATMTRDGGAS